MPERLTTRRSLGRRPALNRWFSRAVTLLSLALLSWQTAATASQALEADEPAPQPTANPAPAGPASAPVGAIAQINNLAVITIEGAIDAITSRSFERRMSDAIDGGADGVVVEIDSPGGEVGAVREICKVIKAAAVPTIGWVNIDAYSGGAIVALACDEIVLGQNATMGDAAVIAVNPLMGLQSLPETEREKLLGPIITELVDSAQRNGYDEVLVIGFAKLGVETWLVEHKDTGERFFLTEREYKALFNEEPSRATPLVQSGGDLSNVTNLPAPPPTLSGPTPQIDPPNAPGGPGGSVGGAAGAELPEDASPGLQAVRDVAGESLAAQANLGTTSISTRPDFAQADPEDYRFIQYATDGQTLLTLKGPALRAFGFVRHSGTIDSDQDLMQYTGAQNMARLNQSWSESLVGFMTSGASGLIIRGLLIALFLLGLFIEMASPGVGVAGTIALIALAGLVIPPMMMGASHWWTIVAIGLGVLLMGLEIFVFPGFGLPGGLGLLCVVGGLVGSFAGAGELFPGQNPTGASSLGWSIATVMLAIFAAGVGIYFFGKYTRSIPIARGLVLNDTLSSYDTHKKASTGSSDGGLLAAMGALNSGAVAVGDEGFTTTACRPQGDADFNGAIIEVVSDLGFVPADTRVRVVDSSGARPRVTPVDGEPESLPADGGIA
jgi:membrane-bound serine protease (ClpP class)